MTRAPQGLILLLITFLSPTGVTTRLSLGNQPHEFHMPVAASEADSLRSLVLAAPTYVAPTSQNLQCSPAPCVLPNVPASAGPNPVNETPIVVNPTNPQQLLASGNDWNCGQNLQGYYTSDDGGTTWTRTCVTTLGPEYFADGDPGVAYDLQGTAYASGLQSGIVGSVVAFQKSTDNGKTWSESQLAVPAMYLYNDKDWLQIDTNLTSPYANTLYICDAQIDAHSDTLIAVSHSNDGGQTWTAVALEPLQIYPVFDDACYMTIGGNGTVYLTWLRCIVKATGNGYANCGGTASIVEFSQSTDGGNTWTTPTAILHTREAPYIKCKSGNFGGFYGTLPNTCDRVNNNPVIAVDNSTGPHQGNLYIAYYQWTGTFLKLFVASSSDGGSTWKSMAVAPPSDMHDQFFPWISVSSAGVVGVSWLDRRNDPQNINYEAFAAFSTDGGASFGRNIDLSAKPSNPNNDGFNAGSHFMGDYTGNSWSADGATLFVTFTDTTTGVDQDFITGVVR